jgi:hypothetical protein
MLVKLEGTVSNRSAIGAIVVVTSGDVRQARTVLSQSSYYSHDDLRLHFGLGTLSKADRIEITWPSGRTQSLNNVPGRRVVTIREDAPK